MNALTKFHTKPFDLLQSLIGPFPSETQNFPRYDLVRIGQDRLRIDIALAGYALEDLEINTVDRNLIVTGKHTDVVDEGSVYLVRGLAKRSFVRNFALGDNLEVGEAKLVNGILSIELKVHIPDEKKPRRIEITSGENRMIAA